MSSNPQWKMFQPPVTPPIPLQNILDLQHPSMQPKPTYRNGSYSSEYPSSPRDSYGNSGNAGGGGRYSNIGGFNLADSCPMGDTVGVYNSTLQNSSQNFDSAGGQNNVNTTRETGIIEKLLHSYGFIQCCERQARLFFHFSQFSGNIEHLKIGDPVEFEMTYDRRTGKPIASSVSKIAPEVVMSEARVTGTVTTEVRGEGSGDTTGRISYENRGECFFLPYTKDDVEGNVTLRSGDAVSFQIATNQRGNLGACHVRLENPVHPVKYHGVVCSLKESFGFIERADVVKEIFFHFSETKIKEDLNLGDDVEFIIQTRNGKEVACNITRLPGGSVIFEDVSEDVLRGQVLKPLERNNASKVHQNDPLPGRIRYRAPDHSEVEVPFGDKDQHGEFTLRHGDWVQFQVATDRRDALRRATNISLLDESFHVSSERRERGMVCSLKDGFGMIKCVDRQPKVFFHFSEILRMGQELSVGDEVEFTIEPVNTFTNSNVRQTAIRIKHLPPGSVHFEHLIECGVRGTVTVETPALLLKDKGLYGTIAYIVEGIKKTIQFYSRGGIPKVIPRVGDMVTFDIYQVKSTKDIIALNVVVLPSKGLSNLRHLHRGFIAALKDSFGFIETRDLKTEVFFHFSNLDGNPDALELGGEVEYTVGRAALMGGCSSADTVRILPRGTIGLSRPDDLTTLQGSVTRTLRALNPDQQQYCGLIQTSSAQIYEFGIIGLACRRELLQIGDPVSFQVDFEGRATNIVPIRRKRRSTVDAIKGGFGFLSLEVEEGKKLFFHMSEVQGNPSELQSGDIVEFVLVTNQRNGKSSACNVTRMSDGNGYTTTPSGRPERLLSRLRMMSMDDTGPRTVVTRQPRGPDGTRGFRPRRLFSPYPPKNTHAA